MSRNGARPDLLVVGGGVIGLSVGREAARRGLKVLVLDRGEAGRGASWAAAGMLSPLAEVDVPGPFLDFGIASLRMYRDWVREIVEEVDAPVEYRECGKILLAFSPSDLDGLRKRKRLAERHSIPVTLLDSTGLEREEPALAPALSGGLLLEDDFRVDNRALVVALRESAHLGGVEIRTGTEVRTIQIEGDRAAGVVLADGTGISAGAVLVAAGAWSGELKGMPRPVPVRPVRGQMLSLAPTRPISTRMLEAADGYLVPRDDGRLLVGATMEEAGFREENTVDGTSRLLAVAHRIAPGLGSARVVELWSGLRPASLDGLPILGPDPDIANLYLATGHFRNGILLAPSTAASLGAAIAGDPIDPLPPEFLPGRMLAHEGSTKSS